MAREAEQRTRSRRQVRGFRAAVAALLLSGALQGAALADDSAVINLAGVQIRNATNQSRESTPDTISPGSAYRYVVDGLVRGNGGVLGALFPSPTPLAQVLETLSPGSAAALSGEIYNPSGQLPLEVQNQALSGSTTLLGITVTYAATISTGIRADGVAYFSVTNVVLTPSILVGYLSFTSGTATVTRIPALAGDMNWDGTVNNFDIDAFLLGITDAAAYATMFGRSPLYCGDANRDGSFDNFDIDPFIALLGQ